MANYFATTGADVVNETNTANGTSNNDNIYLQNDITLTSGQFPNLNSPSTAGTLRFRGGTPAGYPTSDAPANPVNYRLTVVDSLTISDTTVGTAQPSFTIGPLTLQIGNGTTAGGIAGNLRVDDGGVLAFNRSVDTTYTGTLSVEDEGNAVVNDVAGTTVTLTGTAGTPGGVAIRASQTTGAADGYELTLGGVGNGVVNGIITDQAAAGSRTNGALTKSGSGTWTLTGANTYAGGTTLSGGNLVLGNTGAAGTGDITFSTLSGTATARLTIDTTAQVNGVTFGNTIANFNGSSELDLAGLTNASVSFNSSNSLLTVTGLRGGSSFTQSFTLDQPTSTAFEARGDGNGGTVIVVCFASGTRIRTTRGDVPVETLSIGERAVTASGETRPIRWIGTQTLDCRNHPKPGAVLPIRIAAGALGDNRPTRDLWVSPRHGLCLDLLGEVLVPADALINGATITQESVESVTYWHIELDSHDLLMAEGVAAESYLDLGNRTFFGGSPDAIPDAAGAEAPLTRADCCRPFVEAGPVLAFARERLRERAVALGWSLRPDPVAGLHVVADGQVIAPRITGTTACFLLPAHCGDVRLVSGTSVPEHVTGTGGRRRLGVDLRGLTLDDGLTVRQAIALDDVRLGDGFHKAEGAGAALHRWTKGDARLPSSLWAECRDVFFLRIELGGERLLRWHAPEGEAAQAAEPAKPRLRLVEAA